MSMTIRRGARVLLLIVVLAVPVVAPAATGPSGTLTVAYATLFDENLNPLLGPAPSKVFYDVMYEYLVYNDPQTLKAEPGLAERWTMSPDGKRWIFVLRKGLTFSDGTEFTAEDVKFSLELLVRKESRWPFRSTYLRVEPPAAQDRRAIDPARAVLHAAARRRLLDGAPLSADPPAHRAAGVASDMIGRAVPPLVEPTGPGVSSVTVSRSDVASTEAQSRRWGHENGRDHGSRRAGISDEAGLARVQGSNAG